MLGCLTRWVRLKLRDLLSRPDGLSHFVALSDESQNVVVDFFSVFYLRLPSFPRKLERTLKAGLLWPEPILDLVLLVFLGRLVVVTTDYLLKFFLVELVEKRNLAFILQRFF